ncbi:MAG: hypothetical protein RLY70_4599 [Planctomycetota bacterium]|jgi:uncharacterized RDD family membrane protein YckC
MSIATTSRPLDTAIDIVTPENIAFSYRVAGPFRRLPALVVDYLIRVIAFGFLVFLALLVSGLVIFFAPSTRGFIEPILSSGAALMVILWFVLDWFYGGFLESYWNGQTPGKWLLGLRVVTTAGQPINGLQAVMRNVFRYADLFPLMSIRMFNPLFGDAVTDGLPDAYLIPTMLVGLGAMIFSPRFQRLGDLLCGTMVILEDRKWLLNPATLEDPRTPHLAALLPVEFVVPRSMARALSLYVDRRRFFQPERRREVARHLAEPLIRQFGLLPDTSHDLLLCALYYRTFIADRPQAGTPNMAVRR